MIRVRWWIWSLVMLLAVVYGIAAAAGASSPNTVAFAAGLPIWLVLAGLVRLGQRRQSRHAEAAPPSER